MAYVTISIYDADGRIVRTMEGHDDGLLRRTLAQGMWVAGEHDGSTHYVDLSGPEPVVTPRPEHPGFDKTSFIADETDAARIENLPVPCWIYVGDESFEETDGWAEIATDTAGKWQVEIPDPFPYLPYSVTLTALPDFGNG